MKPAARWLAFTALALTTLCAWCEGSWTVSALLFALLAAAAMLRYRAPLPSPVLVAAAILLAVCAWGALQIALHWTVYAYNTSAAATLWCAAAGVVIVSAQAFAPRDPELWTGRFALFTAALATLSMVQLTTSHGRFLWIFESGYPDIYGPFPSYMDQAALCELAFPIALTRALGQRDRGIYAVAAALMVGAVVMSASRAGAIFLAVESLAVAALVLTRRRVPLRRLAPRLAIFAVVAIALSAAAGWDHLANRLAEPHPYAFRRNVLVSTIEMVRERPAAGFGLGNFEVAYPAYALFDDGTRVNRAHNDWAEWAAEGGLPLAAAMAVIALITLKPALRTIWALGIPIVFLHSTIDYPLRRLAVAGWFWLLTAILLATRRAQRRQTTDCLLTPDSCLLTPEVRA